MRVSNNAGSWLDVGILTASTEDGSQIDGKTLRSQGERQDLDGVSDGQWSERDVVEGEENEKEGDSCTASRLDGMFREGGAQCCNDDERGKHATS